MLLSIVHCLAHARASTVVLIELHSGTHSFQGSDLFSTDGLVRHGAAIRKHGAQRDLPLCTYEWRSTCSSSSDSNSGWPRGLESLDQASHCQATCRCAIDPDVAGRRSSRLQRCLPRKSILPKTSLFKPDYRGKSRNSFMSQMHVLYASFACKQPL